MVRAPVVLVQVLVDLVVFGAQVILVELRDPGHVLGVSKNGSRLRNLSPEVEFLSLEGRDIVLLELLLLVLGDLIYVVNYDIHAWLYRVLGLLLGVGQSRVHLEWYVGGDAPVLLRVDLSSDEQLLGRLLFFLLEGRLFGRLLIFRVLRIVLGPGLLLRRLLLPLQYLHLEFFLFLFLFFSLLLLLHHLVIFFDLDLALLLSQGLEVRSTLLLQVERNLEDLFFFLHRRIVFIIWSWILLIVL